MMFFYDNIRVCQGFFKHLHLRKFSVCVDEQTLTAIRLGDRLKSEESKKSTKKHRNRHVSTCAMAVWRVIVRNSMPLRLTSSSSKRLYSSQGLQIFDYTYSY